MADKDTALLPSLPMPFTPVALMETSLKWLELTARNIESMLEASQGTMNHFKACQEVSVAFVRDRMAKSQDYSRTALAHRDFEGLVHAGAAYQRTLVEDYIRLGQRLGDMTLNSINEHIEPIERRAQEALNTMGKAA